MRKNFFILTFLFFVFSILIANRIKVEQEYKELEKDYYDEKGKVFDLIKLTVLV